MFTRFRTNIFSSVIFFLFFFLCAGSESFGGTISIRWADVLPPLSPSVQAMNKIAKEVNEKTEGRVELKIFPSGQLGSSKESIESVIFGGVDMITEGAANFGQILPALSILEAPYIWKDYTNIAKVMKSPVGAKLKDSLLKQSGIRVLGVFYNGVRHVTTTDKPVYSLKDMKGLKLRVPENEVFLSMAKAWGTQPTAMNFSELYFALRQKLLGGQENPLPTIDDNKFYEVQKYVILTGHIMTPRLIVINEGVWSRISKKDQEILLIALENGIAFNNAEIVNREKSLVEKFKKLGLQVIEPDKKEFQQAVSKVFPGNFEQVWGKGLYQEILAMQR